MQGVDIPPHPKKMRLSINKAYIQANYTNELDNVQGLMLEPQSALEHNSNTNSSRNKKNPYNALSHIFHTCNNNW
ncbi:hypothetical protein VIGAN_07140200 [Vigna angularis var. angularis]|uniref:Uncharacterized protein n=1 Tax=Vigna angularis var. angularis TaxID=157739 RepID=A0A0S3SIJ2_PHAAN|nr:hypothetical protein VIGAN_07140200 [Vigna angularis var. angularis]